MARHIRALVVLLGLAGLCAVAPPAFAQDNRAAAAPGLKLAGDQPIQIESDRLEVDEVKATATFTGNVNVIQGETQLKADRMVVYYKQAAAGTAPAAGTGAATGGLPSSSSTTIDRMEVNGNVYVKSGTQIGTGESGTYDVNTNTLTLTGKEVVLTDGPTVLVGCKLVVQMTTSKSTFDGCGGRVRMNRDESKAQPKT